MCISRSSLASSFIGDYSRLDSTDLLINMNKLFKTKFATMIRNIELQSNTYSEISITLSTEGYRSFFLMSQQKCETCNRLTEVIRTAIAVLTLRVSASLCNFCD